MPKHRNPPTPYLLQSKKISDAAYNAACLRHDAAKAALDAGDMTALDAWLCAGRERMLILDARKRAASAKAVTS